MEPPPLARFARWTDIKKLRPWGLSLFGKCQEGDATGSLDRLADIPLMRCAIARDPPRNDLAPFRHEIPKQPGVFIIDMVDLIGAEAAIFLPLNKPAFFH
jgi:hypothetical protein